MTNESVATTLRQLADAYAAHLQSTLGDRLVSVVLFGSVARGDPSPTSDIDLLIVADGLPQGHFARKRTLAAADAALEPELRAAEEAAARNRGRDRPARSPGTIRALAPTRTTASPASVARRAYVPMSRPSCGSNHTLLSVFQYY